MMIKLEIWVIISGKGKNQSFNDESAAFVSFFSTQTKCCKNLYQVFVNVTLNLLQQTEARKCRNF